MVESVVIGKARFTDGTNRVVYRDAKGQFVLDDDEAAVYGTWILESDGPKKPPLDNPFIVEPA
jgi:hypothetical protein